MAREHLVWTDGEVKDKLFHSAIFDVGSIERTASDGRKATFLRMRNPNWVTIIPWRRREDGVAVFMMEEQFRHGLGAVTREFPAGLVEEGEDALVAAKREFLEETGFEGDFTKLGEVNPNPAYMTNRQTYFLVENYHRVSEQNLDENEQIDILEVPVAEAVEEMGEGLYYNGIMMSALGFFLRLCEKRPELRR